MKPWMVAILAQIVLSVWYRAFIQSAAKRILRSISSPRIRMLLTTNLWGPRTLEHERERAVLDQMLSSWRSGNPK